MVNLILKARIIQFFGTQHAFAKKIKTQASTVSRVVRGRENLTQREQEAWARCLKSSAKELFCGDGRTAHGR